MWKKIKNWLNMEGQPGMDKGGHGYQAIMEAVETDEKTLTFLEKEVKEAFCDIQKSVDADGHQVDQFLGR